MNFNNYDNKELLIDSVTEHIADSIRTSIENYGDARILLSGGSTPGPVYEQLSRTELDWTKVHVGLVDERFVPFESEFSNERLLSETLLQNTAKDAHLTGMVFDTENRNSNVEMAQKHYKTFMERTDFVLLGMGGDGHTASLFPGDEMSEADLNKSSIGLINTQAPNHPEDRISCSKSLLLNSKKIALMITGASKLEVLQNTDNQLPIHRLLKERTNIDTYYTE